MIIGSDIIFVRELTSTNTYAIDLLNLEKPGEGTIIYSLFQAAGRGQPGNRWESEYGKNLLFSFILYPSMIKPGHQFFISMAVSLGVTDFLSGYLKGCTIKWPNDIYAGNDKIAGILIESSIMRDQIEYLVAGIGLNVNQEKFISSAPNPISMKLLTGRDYDLKECLEEIATCLDKRYAQLRSGKRKGIRDEYISKLYRFEQWAVFRDSGGAYTGRIVSVTGGGKLIVERRSGALSEYFMKEVEFINSPGPSL